MLNKTPAELQADWIAMSNIARFQEKLNAETDESRHRILAALLSEEFQKFHKAPRR